MAKTKYNPKTFPRLAKGYALRGLTDAEVADKLNISKGSFYTYQKKYPEFAEAVEQGKFPINLEVEAALLKRALGYEFEETKVIKVGDKEVKKETTKKHIPANPDTIKFWLINRASDRWALKQEVKMQFEKMDEESLNTLAEKIIKGEEP